MTEVLEALIAHLLTVSAVTDLTSTRIFGGELPEAEVASMPRKVLVLRLAGGIEQMRSARTTRVRVDVFSYGEGYYQAGRVDRAVADALMDLRRVKAADTLLHAAGYGGPFQLKEPGHGWRYVARTAIVAYDERTAA